MKVVPKLNLNKHPEEVTNGSLVDAINIIASKDNAVIQTEPYTVPDVITEAIENIIDGDGYNILYCIPCNDELVLFVQHETDEYFLHVYRFNEKLGKIKRCTRIRYSGGKIIGTFTYNFNNLIIAISEYFEDDSNNIPLKTINLGTFTDGVKNDDSIQLNSYMLHSICPQVKIPTITVDYTNGSTYKGWYYVFIRYKISNNTYTQWFNTNSSIIIGDYDDKYIQRYVLAYNNNYYVDEGLIPKNEYRTGYIVDNVSSDIDISHKTFVCNISDLDRNYNYYQLGFICINKSYSKSFRSNDLTVANTIKFDVVKDNLIEYNNVDLITSYYNYYNVKTLINDKNRLYIANYKEHDNFKNIAFDTTFNINFTIEGSDEELPPVPPISKASANSSNLEDGTYKDKDISIYNGDITIDKDTNEIVDGLRFTVKGDVDISGGQFQALTIHCGEIPFATNKSDHGGGVVGVYKLSERKDFTEDTLITVRYKVTDKEEEHEIYAHQLIFVRQFNSISYLRINYVGNEYVYLSKLELIKIGNDEVHLANTITLFPYAIICSDNTKISIPDIGVGEDDDWINNNPDDNILGNRSYDIISGGFIPEEDYAFYIHFVDKYGAVSEGYDLTKFGTLYLSNSGNFANAGCVTYNKLNTCIVTIPKPAKNAYGNKINATISFNCSAINSDFGWFISYEKLEKHILYKGILDVNKNADVNNIYFYSDELNYVDSIDFSFDTIKIFDTLTTYTTASTNFDYYLSCKDINPIYELNVKYKELCVADSFNNFLMSTRIRLRCEDFPDDGKYIAYLCKSTKPKYNKLNKTLIPCTNISYFKVGINSSKWFDTNTSFISRLNAMIFKEVFFDATTKAFIAQSYRMILNIIKTVSDKSVLKAFENYHLTDYFELPNELIQYNNKPAVTFFPVKGIDSSNENAIGTGVRSGYIVEAKDTVDLFKMTYLTIGDCHPKSLTWNNPNVYRTTDFPKTIRRSNPIQDESNTNAWREFKVEQYKNISENKGDIIKLVSIGYYFIAHTQHSMFLFNAVDTIKSNETDIQLASVDIWDIDYKEVITSNLGYAGIQKEYSGIVGEFGYVFYDADAKRFYRYDNSQITYIDNDVVNFISKLNGYNVHFVDDKQRDRLMVTLFKDGVEDIVLSYNYKLNTFVSRHDYNFYRGYSTKEHTYIFTNLVDFTDSENNHNRILKYVDGIFRNANVHIMINTNYLLMKYLEYLIYKIHTVTPKFINDFSPVEENSIHYAGNQLRVYSEFCDTGVLNVEFDNPDETINTVMDYAKPYWRYGNWHFNMLRNKLDSVINGELHADESSRLFGNWFVVNIDMDEDKQVELESIDCKFENAELI